jgi:membrane protein YdbS with pleckstrin-like domain
MVLAFSALLLIFVHWFYLYKSFPLAGYALREKDVVYKRGWVIQSLRICPFNRIQNCTVQSGPIERRYGLASVIVYTAGSAGADMKIHGLKSEEADRLRQFILQQIHKEDEVL